MIAYLKQGEHLFYKIEKGKVTGIDTKRKWIKYKACVPSIYANVVEVIKKEDWENAKNTIAL